MKHTPHPAIRRGRYELVTFNVGRLAASGQVRVLSPVSILVRVVDFDADIEAYLERVAPVEPDASDELTEENLNSGGIDAEELVQLVAPVLRGGLLDPGNGREVGWRPPVQMVLDGARLRFMQMAVCLN